MTEAEMAIARRVNEDEGRDGYRRGGYHPVRIGDTFNQGRYLVVSKVGWGHFSTVWRAYDTSLRRYVALKIVKSAPQYTEAAMDEIRIMQRIATTDPENTSCCLHLLNNFVHLGPNGTRLFSFFFFPTAPATPHHFICSLLFFVRDATLGNRRVHGV